MPKKLLKLYTDSGLPPFTLKCFRSTLLNHSKVNQNFLTDFRESQNQFSLQFLQNCNKTALLLYSSFIWEYENGLRYLGKNKISVRKSIIFESKFGLQTLTWLPEYVIKRLRGVENSGLVEWWNSFVSIHIVKIRSKSKTNKTFLNEKTQQILRDNGMKTKHLIITRIILVGNTVSVSIFVLETCLNIIMNNISVLWPKRCIY